MGNLYREGLQVIKSYNCNRVSSELINNILCKTEYKDNGIIGKGLKNNKFDSVMLCEDSIIASITVCSNKCIKVPDCFKQLLDYIMNLYETDFNVSSISICETNPIRGVIDLDIVNAKTQEVYTYKFRNINGIIEYDDYYPEDTVSFSRDEQYFPMVESDEPEKEIMDKLINDVLNFCNKYNFPIRRICIFSVGNTVNLAGKLCKVGIGHTKNYYGLSGEYDDKVRFNLVGGEYDLCFLVEK